MAAALLKLQRFDEALDVLEETLRDYSNPQTAQDKQVLAQAGKQADQIRPITGTISVTEAEPGAMIIIDGRVRGEHPTPKALNVLAGPHFVRVYKGGFSLYEKSITVEKGKMETLSAKLTPLVEATSGRLKVGEVDGKKMEVVVDGVPVGMTPWEGPISAGEHSVVLRQPPAPPVKLAACDEPAPARPSVTVVEETLAATPVTVVVKPRETALVQMKAEPLDASLKILPAPATATLFLDGVRVSKGGFDGRLRPGDHVIKAQADGYFDETQTVNVPAGTDRAVDIKLRRDNNASIWAEAGRFLFEIGGSAPISPSFGGDVAATCSDACQQSLGVGGRITLRGGYELGNGFGFGFSAGYMGMQQSTNGRDATLLGATGSSGGGQGGVANDTLTIQNAMLGGYAGIRLGKIVPVRLGVGAGISLGSISDVRTGLFGDSAVGSVTQSGFFAWAYVEPELRVSLHLSERFSLGINVSGLVLMAPRVPQWRSEMLIEKNTLGHEAGTFNAETITGSTIFAITEGLFLTYEL